MLPVVALVGRPNVGKSTLFNILTRSRDALVVDLPGVTRDRHYGVCHLTEQPFVVVDTGGLADEEDGLNALTAHQVHLAVDESDVVVLLVDARDGLLPRDNEILRELRRRGKPVLLAVNKTDGMDEAVAMADFATLGFADSLALSAAHNRGTQTLIDTLQPMLPVDDEPAPDEETDLGIRVAIVDVPMQANPP